MILIRDLVKEDIRRQRLTWGRKKKSVLRTLLERRTGWGTGTMDVETIKWRIDKMREGIKNTDNSKQDSGKSLLRGLLNKEVDKRKTPYVENPIHPQKVGKRFEDEVEFVMNIYHDLGLAHIEKNNSPTLFIPPKYGKPGFMIYRKKTACDFAGAVIANPSYPMFIEAKSTQEGILPLYQEKTGLKATQIKTLLWLEKHKIPHFILWKIKSGDGYSVYRTTISEILKAAGEKKSVNIMDLAIRPLMKKMCGTIAIFDFLDLLL